MAVGLIWGGVAFLPTHSTNKNIILMNQHKLTGEFPEFTRKRVGQFLEIGRKTANQKLQRTSWVNSPPPYTQVRDEVERAIHSLFNASSSHSVDEACPSGRGGGSGLQLRFVNKLPATIFTGGRIETEDGTSLQVILMDASSHTVIKSAPLSSIKIEIVAVNGDFGSDDQEDWTEKEFNNSILREREGRRPLLTGELTLTLREGVGYLGNIIFTDNSSWIRSRKFRLGARVVQKNSADTRIREAISEAFVVKDHRGELYKKHHPPFLHDDVWRLEKIAKDGAFHKRLASYAIHTVKDFLQMHTRDPVTLRDLILNGISNRTWNAIIEHAICFVNDNKLYAYQRPEQDVIIYFNSILKVEGANFNGQFCPVNAFTPSQKALVENIKQQAYRNVHDMVLIKESIAGPPRPLASLQAQPFDNDPMQHDFQIMHQDQQVLQLGLGQSTTPSPFPGGSEGNHQLVISTSQNNHPSFVFQPSHRNSFSIEDFFSTHYDGEPSWLSSSSQGPIVPSNHFITENLFQVQSSTSPVATTWEQGPGFFFASNNDAEAGIFPSNPGFVHVSRDGKRKASWSKIRAAFKCWLSVKLAARRMARPMYLGYS
ncbi:hypothetical protein L484_000923 [Morus notabilis]|uniref:Uncharacterized protein n=1 Tax=Morus notabilis TaxID=981085 RepID=W9S402_9ROSA|nr:hypothetical protein L484_000923 [Morus notabilis]